MPESLDPSQFLKIAKSLSSEFRTYLRQLVECESPSHDKQQVDRAVELVRGWFADIGARERLYKQREVGNVLQLDFAGRTREKPVLLLGHVDTVWELGTLARMPWREAQGKIFGPGIFDMKFGVVQMLFALRILRDAEGRLPGPVTILLNTDEETGSHHSRPITERLALKSSAVLVFEPSAGPAGACKTSRKGVGQYHLRVQGVASHAGLDFEKGASAVYELARQLARIAEFSDPSGGLTVNAGIIRGGTRTNVIADSAEAEIDVRVTSAKQVREIEKKFAGLKPFDKRCKVEIAGGINRMPFERNPETVRLYRKAAAISSELGFVLEEKAVGGGSDGNFTAALGVPTLDGLGAVGDGAHASHEHIIAAEIPRRIAFAARLISDL